MHYTDRQDAGRHLARLLERYKMDDPVVFGLVRGGMPVAAEVAAALGAPLDALVVRKVGVPMHPELAMGAVAEGITWLDESLIGELRIRRSEVDRVVAEEVEEMKRREALYRSGQPPLSVKGRTVIVVDDGLATGATARAAIQMLRRGGAAQVIFASPVCSRSGARQVAADADTVVCASQPTHFFSVSQAYDSFDPVSDSEVRHLLDASAASAARPE